MLAFLLQVCNIRAASIYYFNITNWTGGNVTIMFAPEGSTDPESDVIFSETCLGYNSTQFSYDSPSLAYNAVWFSGELGVRGPYTYQEISGEDAPDSVYVTYVNGDDIRVGAAYESPPEVEITNMQKFWLGFGIMLGFGGFAWKVRIVKRTATEGEA